MSQIELKFFESNQIKPTIESNQTEKQLSLTKLGIVSQIHSETAASKKMRMPMTAIALDN